MEWVKATPGITRECVSMMVMGLTGSGKTSYALTAPGPIYYFHSAETGIDGVVGKYAAGKDVYPYNFISHYQGTPQQVKTQAMKDWNAFKARWYDAFERCKGGTIVLDTETDCWELARLAYFGDAKPAGGRMELNWGPINADYKALFKYFRTQNSCNLIVIDHAEYERIGDFGKLGDKLLPKGQKNIAQMMDVNIRCEMDVATQKFWSTVDKGWYNAGAALGLKLEGQLSTFPMVMSVITESDAERWS